MFRSHRLATLAGTVITAAALGLTAVATAGLAAAENPALSQRDTTFLNELTSQGIGFTSPQGALQDANGVCADLGDGVTGTQEVAMVLKNADQITRGQAAFFVVDSVKTYCPQHSHQLNA
jgi:hypothetical protein